MRHNCPAETYIDILQKLHNLRVMTFVSGSAVSIINKPDHINDSGRVISFPVSERLAVLDKPRVDKEIIEKAD